MVHRPDVDVALRRQIRLCHRVFVKPTVFRRPMRMPTTRRILGRARPQSLGEVAGRIPSDKDGNSVSIDFERRM